MAIILNLTDHTGKTHPNAYVKVTRLLDSDSVTVNYLVEAWHDEADYINKEPIVYVDSYICLVADLTVNSFYGLEAELLKIEPYSSGILIA